MQIVSLNNVTLDVLPPMIVSRMGLAQMLRRHPRETMCRQ